MKFDDLVFPQLLPGHKWVVKQDTDAFSSWDQLVVQIRRDRRWFTYLGYSMVFWLSRAETWWKNVNDGEPGNLPEEAELWKQYVMANANALHEKYVRAHQVPIKNQQVKDAVKGWEDELNA